MAKDKGFLSAFLAITILLSFYAQVEPTKAENEQPRRQTELVITVTEFEWWVIRWSDNLILCRVVVDHEELPESRDILRDCGREVYDIWRTTPPCPVPEGGDRSECPGVYLHQVTTRPGERTIIVDLPPPTVYLTLADCEPTIPDNRCPFLPTLQLTGIEPLPNESIVAIYAIMNGRQYSCEGEICLIQLRPTPREGVTLEFWADSSFTDSSNRYTALIRVLETGVVEDPRAAGWFVDVISTQWRGRQILSCAQTWQAFPPVGTPPFWLTTPEFPEILATAEDLQFLAGRLIQRGVVDASDCPGGGLLPNGYADACGLERARSIVHEWQNQFDDQIIQVALETGVPAVLLKRLFAQESQFWPGGFNGINHLGLGHITSKGADTLLLWNRSFFDQFCPLILDEAVCQRGYLMLDDEQRAMLRGALALQATAECPECPAGIDLSYANMTIDLFAQTLLANCDQVAQIIFNASRMRSGNVSTYEDLWRFTLANYHAGPGCLSYAIHNAWTPRGRLTWENVSGEFTPVCEGVVVYVDTITR
jgi:hypothetical protein